MNTRGFTVIEFIVVMTIFVIMAGVTLFNFKSFQSDVALSNLAYDIALTLRRAQVMGSSGFGEGGDTSVRGIHFRKDSGGDTFSSELTFFQDTGSDDFEYDGGDEKLEVFSINTSDTIKSICLATAGDMEECLDEDGGASTLFATEDVSISFKRPDPKAYINLQGNTTQWSVARITIQSVDTNQQLKFVDVYSSGLISIP